MKKTDVRFALTTAFTAAQKACYDMIKENPGEWYPCGFAWVRIKPARGALVSHLKSIDIGRVDGYAGGYVIYNPAGSSTQWLDAKMAGAKAIAEVLRQYGVECNPECRMD